jgi:hypothetical protein
VRTKRKELGTFSCSGLLSENITSALNPNPNVDIILYGASNYFFSPVLLNVNRHKCISDKNYKP